MTSAFGGTLLDNTLIISKSIRAPLPKLSLKEPEERLDTGKETPMNSKRRFRSVGQAKLLIWRESWTTLGRTSRFKHLAKFPFESVK